jgi:hypothetical protein
MKYLPKHFDLDELVCPHVFKKYGEQAWQFLDPRLLITLDFIREKLNKLIYINSWGIGGSDSQSGFRCIECGLVKKAIKDKEIYVSAHMEGQGVDMDIEGMNASEVRLWLAKHEDILPYPIRLEANVEWVHLDVREDDRAKVYLFKV